MELMPIIDGYPHGINHHLIIYHLITITYHLIILSPHHLSPVTSSPITIMAISIGLLPVLCGYPGGIIHGIYACI